MAGEYLTVKVTTQHPDWPLLRQTPQSSGIWGRFQFVVNEPVDRCDYWIVCDGLPGAESTSCPPSRTFLVTWEPPRGVRPEYDPRFVSQFAHLLTCHRRLRHPDVRHGLQGHPWFVGRSYDELRHSDLPDKSSPLVIVTSSKAFSRGHRARLEFALGLKQRLGDAVQLVGRGIADFEDKWDVLAPTRYAVAVENFVADDWLTEKLPDCYLAGAFPIYHGAPNAEKYFASSSFAEIDIADLDGATRLIERLLADDSHYEGVRDDLLTARNDYLDRRQFFPLMSDLLTCAGGLDVLRSEPVTLTGEEPPSLARRIRHKMVGR